MFPYTLLGSWKKRELFLSLPVADELGERGRLILTSDGTLTRLLQALYSDVRVELKGQSVERVSDDSCKVYGIKGGEEVIKRDVWLTGDGIRLVFAHSIIPVKMIPSEVDVRLRHGLEPLGSILEDSSLFCKKAYWEVGRVISPDMARGLGIPEEHIFWARRYQILAESGLMAIVMEIFTPYLLDIELESRGNRVNDNLLR